MGVWNGIRSLGGENHFSGWPRWNSTNHQQSYYKWLERAHRGGLQLTVMMAVTNESMCIAGRRLDYPEFTCATSKGSIDMQLDKAFELEAWLSDLCEAGHLINAQGPAQFPIEILDLLSAACATPDSDEGWFKVVKSPLAARKAIARGQLAVVLGIEVANLFNCNEGLCTKGYVEGQLDFYHNKGVRHIFPIHNFDNDYGGAATWMNTIAVGNNYATGEWYEAEDCPNTVASFGSEDGYGFKLAPSISDWLAGLILGTDFLAPVGWRSLDTTCNKIGLKQRGEDLVQHMMSKGMIIDIDHMSNKAVDDTLTLAEDNAYPGIVATHALMFELTKKQYRHERMRTRDLEWQDFSGHFFKQLSATPLHI